MGSKVQPGHQSRSRTARTDAVSINIPELDLTPAMMIERARAMRPILRERQDRCEAGGELPAATNDAFVEAGFYRTVQPRRFGGYEFDVETFLRIMIEIARGCPASGWVLALTAGHPLVMARFQESAQIETYGADGEFRGPFARSSAIATPADGGFTIQGFWDYASGCDIATHFIGSAFLDGEPGKPPRQILLLFDRKDFSIVDNWQMFGMQGTGSRRVVVEEPILVPHYRTISWDLLDGHRAPWPIPRGLDNPMYHGRITSFLVGEATAVAVGIARGALDLYEDLLRTKNTPFPPFVLRADSYEFQQYFGKAHALVDTAEAALLKFGQDFVEVCARHVEDNASFSGEVERRLLIILQQCVNLCWEAVDLMFTTAGTTAARKDSKLGRHFRDLAALRTHVTLQQSRTALNFARLHLGLPPISPM
ncbi:MAG: hypothetical protein Q7S58_05675 [Candidatus Binatus sp.]|uniref:hypothetical protein n=1 Tax=Candidatus Binatus sp. TaxID=2811406 RepID=UPI0027277D8C|nr:hypothetical protein [Candidatus Binatus sp.]MDO8431884.1 hypothetical protein [Candidatus Binatus sp.]